ncbi:MAG: cob(I)yrinic acid a,c-diamide adenosyltransferase [Chloroflexota bacterium]|nr:cob(I)yrinic acid a,c-diamide adenosyltransferase [Chloroflexota bacterium]
MSRATRASIADSIVATGRGDDGSTGLLFGGRVQKDDPRTEAYGTTDEAVAALGMARAEIGELRRVDSLPPELDALAELLLRLQRGLFVVGAELAANPDAWEKLQDGTTRVDEAMLSELETELAGYEARIEMPREFVVPGASRLSASLELTRTILRRAERRAVSLQRDGQVAGPWLVPYLNRLADLVWVLARAAEQAEERSTTLARSAPRSGAAS